MKKTTLFFTMLFSFVLCMAQQPQRTAAPPDQQKPVYPARMTPQMTEFFEPEVKIIQPPAQVGMPPSDAIILFDGSDVNKEWEDRRGNPTKWIVQDGSLVCVKGSGVVQTKRKFNDFQLHIEWKSPSEVQGDGRAGATAEYTCRAFMKSRFSIAIIIPPTGRGRPVLFTNSMPLLLMRAESRENGRLMI